MLNEAQTAILDILAETERPELQTLLLQGFIPKAMRATKPYWIILQPYVERWKSALVTVPPSVLLHEPIRQLRGAPISETKKEYWAQWIVVDYGGYFILRSWHNLWRLSDVPPITQTLEQHGVISSFFSEA